MATEAFKCKLTAILSADVKGYSRLIEKDGIGTIRILKALINPVMVASLIKQHRDRGVEFPGGVNLLAEFLRSTLCDPDAVV